MSRGAHILIRIEMSDSRGKTCYVCGLSFNSGSARYRHAKRVHPDSDRIRRGDVASDSVRGMRVESGMEDADDVGPTRADSDSVEVRA